MPDLQVTIAQAGGCASIAELRRFHRRREIDAAVADGRVLRAVRGRYVLPNAEEPVLRAAAVGGVASHRSAALLHGWGIWTPSQRAEVTVLRQRRIPAARRVGMQLRFRDYRNTDVVDGLVTDPLRTVIDCARDLPFIEALAVADSALRANAVDAIDLRSAIGALPRTGRARAALVLRHADPRAANPFESALRALAVEAVGPVFVPQVRLLVGGGAVRPDLVSRELRVVLEADSHEFHTSRSRLRDDCWRYDELVLDGWLVMRFSWDHVFAEPEWVRCTIRRAVDLARQTAVRPPVTPTLP